MTGHPRVNDCQTDGSTPEGRAALDAIVAAAVEQYGRVLWEGRTVPASTTCGAGSSIVQPPCLDVPPLTRVQLVLVEDRP